LLKAGLEPKPAQTFIIAVPTPFEEIKGEKIPDLSYIEGAVEALAPHLKENNLIVLESTSPVGTTELIAKQISSLRPDLLDEEGQVLRLQIAHCPERVLPGKILQEIIENDRIVGGIDEASTQKAAQFYRTFVRGAVITTNSRTAEMAKLVENSFRDTNIAFANELSMLCDELEIDVWELIQLANRHPRVNILKPGPGVGGHCLAVDPWFIVSKCPDKARLIRTAREVNEYKPKWVVEKVLKEVRNIKNPVVGCLGATYKPDIDDLRESPALEIISLLKDEDIQTIVCEPHISNLYDITLVSFSELLSRSNIILDLVPHSQFSKLTDKQLKKCVFFNICGIHKDNK
jgi:UDP-N-acetyl-D-mannosaminuronic acid dehydrogenase